MANSRLERKLVWAVDPYFDDRTLTRRTAQAVRVLASQWNARVEPVYVTGALPPELRYLPSVAEDIQDDVDRRLRDLLRSAAIPNLAPIRVLEPPSSLLRSKVDHLVAYAKASNAKLIAVGTRAKQGLSRLVLGSFAETLILRSDVPLYVIHPHESIPRSLRHILFPTDFSAESKAALRQVVAFAKELQATLTVYHVIGSDVFEWVDPVLAIAPVYDEILETEVELRRQKADSWVKEARAEGIDAEAVVDYRLGRPVVEAIVSQAERGSSLIAMAAHSGPLSSALLGSVTRQVVRSAPCPVWVVHSERREKARAPAPARKAA